MRFPQIHVRCVVVMGSDSVKGGCTSRIPDIVIGNASGGGPIQIDPGWPVADLADDRVVIDHQVLYPACSASPSYRAVAAGAVIEQVAIDSAVRSGTTYGDHGRSA